MEPHLMEPGLYLVSSGVPDTPPDAANCKPRDDPTPDQASSTYPPCFLPLL
jgi:hypothetical protein